MLLSLIVLVAAPTTSGIALARLVNPFQDIAWPQVHNLAVRDPVQRVARGQPFEIEVIDRYGAEMPHEVRILYRFENPEGPPTQENEPLRFTGGVMTARRESVLRPFSFRIEGGDDHSMPWQQVEVVDAPAVESLTVRKVPPSYTGWPTETSEGNLRALVGTQLEMTGRASKPLASAVLHFGKDRRVPAVIADDRLSFSVPASAKIVVEDSISYWFRLTDQDRMSGGEDARWEIRAIADTPPGVTIEQPQSNIFVTPQATVPIQVTAADDLAIRQIDLDYGRSDQGESDEGWRKTISIYAGPAQPQAGHTAGRTAESLVRRYQWNLESLALRPGMQLTFCATASDYRAQTGKSEPRRVSVITPEELIQRIAARQATLLGELLRVLEMQRQVRGQTAGLQSRAGAVLFEQSDLDRLHGAELNQRRATETLTDRRDGVPSHILSLLADLTNNKIESPAVQRRMEGLLAEIQRLCREELAAISRELTAAIKSAEVRLTGQASGSAKTVPGQDRAVLKGLAAAVENQDRVLASLEQMLDELGRWNSFGQFSRDVNQLLREQEELSRQTAQIGRRSLTRERKDLTPQDVADLQTRGREQLELARRIERLSLGMEQTSGKLQESDPLAAQTLADALARARQLDLAGRMRSAAGQIEQNQLGQAMAGQRQAEEGLREILDLLSGKRENEANRLVKKLREAETALADLAERELQLQKKFEQTAGLPDAETARRELQRLDSEQKRLQQETQRHARQLARLTAEQPAQAAREGAQRMGEACRSAGQGEGSKAAQHSDEARKALEQAQKSLAAQRQQAEAQLAEAERAKFEEAVKSLHTRQDKALQETQRLADLVRQQPLTPGQEASLVDLAREQRLLQTETMALAEKHAEARVFALAVAAAANQMAMAAGLLDRQQTGDATQQSQHSALARLAQVLESLKPEPPEERPQEQGKKGGAGQGAPKRPRNPGGVPDLAQIKLLKLMQEDVNRRTHLLERAMDRGGSETQDARRQLVELSVEQGRLAELLIAIIPPEDEKDLPDTIQLPDVDNPSDRDKGDMP